MLLCFGKEIWNIKGFTKMGFSFILVGSNTWMVYFLIVCCSLGPVLVI